MAEPRPLRKTEAPELADMLGRIFGLNKHYSQGEMEREVGRAASRRNTLVVEVDGKVVSHLRTAYSTLSVYGCQFKVASIGSVGTEEPHRGKGYAGQILEASLREMERRGAKILVVSGDRTLYRRAHCVPAGRLYQSMLTSDFGARASGFSVRKIDARAWPTLAPLQQAEGVRFVRELEFLETRPFWWDCEHPEIWLVERQGAPVAYLGLTVWWPREPTGSKRVMWEYAGSRAALVEALQLALEAEGLDKIELFVLGHDGELRYQLGRRGVKLTETTLSGTHRIIDLPGLMRKLRPYLRERLTRAELRGLSFEQQGERCAISRGEERLEISLSQAAPLVLGGPGAPEVGGELGDVLGRVLPIPFPVPGYDYI